MPDVSRVAVVTGATSGIGRACALRLALAGHAVLAAGRREEELRRLAEEAAPGVVATVAGDMTAPRHAEQLVTAARAELGRPSVFVVSAGQGLPGTVLDSDPERWPGLLDVNVLAPLRQLRAFAQELLAQAADDGGRSARDLVVIGSTVGRDISARNPVYGSTKFALHSLVESLRREVSASGIRVTLIEPGFVRSGFQDSAGYDREWFAGVERTSGPLLVPDDVARTVCFVVDQPSHVHLDDIRLRPTRQVV